MKKGLSVNRSAWRLLEKLLEDPDLYGVKVERASSGATMVDAGIEARGGFEAGRVITEICMGGCGKAEITSATYGDLQLPSILVYTDHPAIATLGSQYAGWQINEKDCFAIGSGPARALALKPKKICEEIGYRDYCEKAVVVLETDKKPPKKLIERVAGECKILSRNLAIIIVPTASVAGATQVSGRIVETGIHKLRRLGLSPNTIKNAWGIAPIAPVHPRFAEAMARTNDAILYGGTAYYSVECDSDERIEEISKKAPSCASKSFGKSFLQILKEANSDFYKIDPDLFAPAIVIINNVRTGRDLAAGKINPELLYQSFGVKIDHSIRTRKR